MSASSGASKNPPKAALSVRAAARTDVGKRRSTNEDVALAREDLNLFVVADGAGGHNSGEVASALAARSLENYFGATIRAAYEQPEFNALGMPSGARRLSAAVQKANRDVVEISRRSEQHRGMGTTVVAASFSPRSGLLHVAHVGDSRCYRLRGPHLELLTQDHSLLTDVLEQRPDLADSALARLPKNLVTRALGMDGALRVSIRSHAVAAGDRYLLCSDGLSGPVPAQAIAAALGAAASPAEAVEALVQLANAAGGPDNIAALVVEFAGDAQSAAAAVDAGVARDSGRTEPELLILGIQDLNVAEAMTASDDLLRAIRELLQK